MSESMDKPHASVARRSLTTPRSAAIAGVLFALLYGIQPGAHPPLDPG